MLKYREENNNNKYIPFGINLGSRETTMYIIYKYVYNL